MYRPETGHKGTMIEYVWRETDRVELGEVSGIGRRHWGLSTDRVRSTVSGRAEAQRSGLEVEPWKRDAGAKFV